MSIITVELPEILTRQVEAQRVPLEELQAVVWATVEVWLAQREQRQGSYEEGKLGRFGESAVPFVRQLIARNRPLFDELAHR
jgi:hypothetical protein